MTLGLALTGAGAGQGQGQGQGARGPGGQGRAGGPGHSQGAGSAAVVRRSYWHKSCSHRGCSQELSTGAVRKCCPQDAVRYCPQELSLRNHTTAAAQPPLSPPLSRRSAAFRPPLKATAQPSPQPSPNPPTSILENCTATDEAKAACEHRAVAGDVGAGKAYLFAKAFQPTPS